jgi:hypothetical protein
MSKLVQRIGRRGAVLGLFGFVWVMFGYSLFTVPPEQIAHAQLLNVGLGTWAYVWTITGGIALLSCVRPGGKDAVGYAAVVLMPTVWAFGYAYAWFSGTGFPRSWISCLTWAAVAGVTAVVAGWKEEE